MMYKKQKSYKNRIIQISTKVSLGAPFFLQKTSSKKLIKSFSILEIVTVILIIAIILSFAIPKTSVSKLDLATNKLLLYLNYTRYSALLDNKYDVDDNEWQKKLWSLKFQRCSEKEDGLYFVVFSDQSGGTGAFKKKETLKDPLNNKYLYSGYDCEPRYNESRNILLTKEYGITKVDVSCNNTSTIGQISFGYNGEIYSSLGMNIKRVDTPCIITLYDKKNNKKQIKIESKTGYIHKL